jgi:hypothetical protein
MAFTLRNLSVLAYAQGFTLWHYRTAAPMAHPAAPGFFSPAADMINTGDMVLVSAADGGGVLFVASAVPGSGVTTTGLAS